MIKGVPCSQCGNSIIGSVRKYQGKIYCEHCYEVVMAEAQRFEEEKQKLINFIKDLFSVQECPEVVLYALDRALKDGKKLSGIKGTLVYYYQEQGNAPDNISLVGNVIQKHYDKAAEYFKKKKEQRAINEKIDINVPPVVVKVHSSTKEVKKPKYRMEDL